MTPPRAFWVLAGTMAAAACSPSQLWVEVIGYHTEQDSFVLEAVPMEGLLKSNRWGPSADLPSQRLRFESLEGERVVVRRGGRMGVNFCALGGEPSRQATRQAAVLDEPRNAAIAYHSTVADMDADGSDDELAVLADHDALVMASAYVLLHDVVSLFARLGETSFATSSPLLIAYDSERSAGCRLPGTLWGVGPSYPEWDNAAYAVPADIMVLMRNMTPGTTAELAVHPGVLSHEFGHRVVEANLVATDAQFVRRAKAEQADGFAGFCQDPTPDDDVEDCLVQDYLRRGMDEGLADVMAYLFTATPAFAARAFGPERYLDREPNGPFAYPIYGALVLKDAKAAVDGPAANYYHLGTLWARGFYNSIVDPGTGAVPQSRQERVDLARGRYARAVFAALQSTGQNLMDNYLFAPPWFVRHFINQLGAQVPDASQRATVVNAACQALCNRFGERPVANPPQAPAPQCSGVIGHNAAAEMHPDGDFPCTL